MLLASMDVGQLAAFFHTKIDKDREFTFQLVPDVDLHP